MDDIPYLAEKYENTPRQWPTYEYEQPGFLERMEKIETLKEIVRIAEADSWDLNPVFRADREELLNRGMIDKNGNFRTAEDNMAYQAMMNVINPEQTKPMDLK